MKFIPLRRLVLALFLSLSLTAPISSSLVAPVVAAVITPDGGCDDGSCFR